jgi:hypothetical protein
MAQPRKNMLIAPLGPNSTSTNVVTPTHARPAIRAGLPVMDAGPHTPHKQESQAEARHQPKTVRLASERC